MNILDPLPSNAPKKWKKQERKRIQKEISLNLQLIKQHSALRKKVGLMQSEYNFKEKSHTPVPIEKRHASEIWGVKLEHSVEVPKKRGRPRKCDLDASQTRIVLFRNAGSKTENNI